MEATEDAAFTWFAAFEVLVFARTPANYRAETAMFGRNLTGKGKALAAIGHHPKIFHVCQ